MAERPETTRVPGSPGALHERLLSHRLRGFSPFEGSLPGLHAALEQGVAWIEIDTRATADGEVLVFHDSRLDRLTASSGPVADYRVGDGGTPRYRGSADERVPTLEEFLREFAANRRTTRLMIDIKDGGTEERHCGSVAAAGLEDCVWIIAWSPQILRRVHRIAPHLPLGFSHVPLARWRRTLGGAARLLGRGATVRAVGRLLARLGLDHNLQDVFVYLDGYDGEADLREPTHGGFPIHLASTVPEGEVGEMLRRTGGGVGTPALMLTPEYVRAAHRAGLSVFVYTFDSSAAARRAVARCDVDIVFTNNAEMFPAARTAA